MDAVPLGPGLGQPPLPWTLLSSTSASTSRARRSPSRSRRPPAKTPSRSRRSVANDPDGFAALAAWLAEHGAGPETALVCLESTGVYGEALCYGLHERGFRVVVEDAAKVRRAMPVAGAKTDALDAATDRRLRGPVLDELRPWAPSRPSWSRYGRS